jgi:para-aminobenzoate synthetase
LAVEYHAADRRVRLSFSPNECPWFEEKDLAPTETIDAFLDGVMQPYRCAQIELNGQAVSLDRAPFQFLGGLAGYFGYEMMYDTMPLNASHTNNTHQQEPSPPTSSFILCNRLVCYDKVSRHVYLLTLSTSDAEEATAREWINHTETLLARDDVTTTYPLAKAHDHDDTDIEVHLADSHHTYLQKIGQCQSFLHQGESYELCLTTQLSLNLSIPRPVPSSHHPEVDFFLLLRRNNPSPFGALYRADTLTVASSSPERFMQIDRDGLVTMKPIKGTRPRSSLAEEDTRMKEELENCVKERAENLMVRVSLLSVTLTFLTVPTR